MIPAPAAAVRNIRSAAVPDELRSVKDRKGVMEMIELDQAQQRLQSIQETLITIGDSL
jgi:hypothetical protein